METTYIVVCTAYEDAPERPYVLATRTVFPNREAADRYASGVSRSRMPLVIKGAFLDLRDDAKERGYV